VSVDLDFDPGQQALADSVSQFCAQRWTEADARAPGPDFTRARWSELAELGVLAVGSPGEEGGALEICAVMEALGRVAFPGPLVASFVAQQVLPRDEATALAQGQRIPALGEPPLIAWAGEAELFLAWQGSTLRRAKPRGPVQTEAALGDEAWGRVELDLGEALPGAQRGLVVGELAQAAYLAAAGGRLVAAAAGHAASRRQFGRAIGEFQAVAHPLADAHIRLEAARMLARAAACSLDRKTADIALERSALALGSATGAALEAVAVSHQVFGAVGITLEGPIFPISRRIRSLASQNPGPAGNSRPWAE
jgi:alkylation response protein AidB-like acyl-CoA dehydrogenase